MVQSDSIAVALDAARTAWADDRDPVTLRRALVELLADLE